MLGGELKARLKRILPEEDLALLQIDVGEHACISLDAAVAMDDELLAVGYPEYVEKKPERDSLRLKYDGKTEAEGGALVPVAEEGH